MTNFFSTPPTEGLGGLDPWKTTGFADGEGSFILSVVRNKKMKIGWCVNFFFSISLHVKDIMILEKIKNSLGVGQICYRQTREAVSLDVTSINEIQIIIEHFEIYPLMTQKFADYVLFKEAIQLIKNKEHLTKAGLDIIVALKGSSNKGLSDKQKLAFPHVVLIKRPIVKDKKIPDPNWIAGFTEAEGCFYVQIYKSNTKLGETVKLVFQLTQHSRDSYLMNNLIEYLECGNVTKDRDPFNFRVTKFDDLVKKNYTIFSKLSYWRREG